jgi:hypothetical protein
MIAKIREFFSTRIVTEKLIAGSLPEGHLFLYFYIVMVFDWLQFTLLYLQVADRMASTEQPIVFSDHLWIWSLFFITILGILICFIVNGGMKGKNFLPKFFSYSVTVGFKYGIAGLVIDNLPTLIPALKLPFYELFSIYALNIAMVSHFAYRISLTRKSTSDRILLATSV